MTSLRRSVTTAACSFSMTSLRRSGTTAACSFSMTSLRRSGTTAACSFSMTSLRRSGTTAAYSFSMTSLRRSVTTAACSFSMTSLLLRAASIPLIKYSLSVAIEPLDDDTRRLYRVVVMLTPCSVSCLHLIHSGGRYAIW